MAFPPSSHSSLNHSGNAVEASHEEVRRKARFRLIGSAILLVSAVITFTWLLDSQPRPIPVDIDIDIPEQSELEALPDSTPVAIPTPAVTTTESPAQRQSDATSAVQGQATDTASADAADAARLQKEKADKEKADKAKAEKAKADKAKADKARADKARAEKEKADKTAAESSNTTTAEAKPQTERRIIHIGSFQDPEQVKQVRARASKAGVPTLIQHVQTSKGPFTRVRVGPFDDETAAKEALKKLKSAGLNDSVIKPLGQ